MIDEGEDFAGAAPPANQSTAKQGLDPRKLAPLFVFTALVHLVSLATRFTDVAAEVPAEVAAGILLGQFPLLLVAGYFEGRLDYGDTLDSLPLWMRIQSKPVKVSFTLAFTYLAVVVLQTWDISIGPIDPTPPPEWSLPQRAQWFAIMSVGMFFPNYLATTGMLVPALRTITKPLHALPAPVAVLISAVVGLALGAGVTFLLSSATATEGVSAAQGAWGRFTEDPAIAIAVAFAFILVPLAFSAVAEKLKGDPEQEKS